MIIDTHCHIELGSLITIPNKDQPFKNYLNLCKKIGITKTVIFSNLNNNSSSYDEGNRKVLNSLKKYDNLYGYIFIHPITDKGKVEKIVDNYINHGFKGIKIHLANGKITDEICKVAENFKIHILYDIKGDTDQLNRLSNKYSNVNFIIPHFGIFTNDTSAWKKQLDFLNYFKEYPNIYTDTSAVMRFDILEKFFREGDINKILFGTDAPFLHPSIELEKIKLLKLDKDGLNKVLSLNFLKLIKNDLKENKEHILDMKTFLKNKRVQI